MWSKNGRKHVYMDIFAKFFKDILKWEQKSPPREAQWGPEAHQKTLKIRLSFVKKKNLLDNLIVKSICENDGHHTSNLCMQGFQMY